MISVPVGSVIGGVYRVLAPRLSFSADADVYAGESIKPGPAVMIVLLRERFAPHGPSRDAFEREGLALSRFSHPGVSQVIDFGIVQGTAYLIIQQPAGELMSEQLHVVRGKPERAVKAIASLHDAIEAAHAAGFAHGALRSRSMILGADGRIIVWDLAVTRLRRAIAQLPATEPSADLAQLASFARAWLAQEETPVPAKAVEPPRVVEAQRVVDVQRTVETQCRPAHPCAADQSRAVVQVHPVAQARTPEPVRANELPRVVDLRRSPDVQPAIGAAKAAAAQTARTAQFARIAPPTPRPPRAPIDREPSMLTPLEPSYQRWLKSLFTREAPRTVLIDTGIHALADTARKRTLNLTVTCAIALLIIVMLIRA